MSAIFKTRKVPRHLIIEDEAERKSRNKSGRLLVIFVLLIVLATIFSRFNEFGLL